MLIDLAASAQLFHNPIGAAYADLVVDGHRETWPVRSPRFRAWLRRRYYAATGEAPSAAELGSALNLLEARAQFDGPERTVHVRLAEHAGHIYLDLADRDWRAVEIGPHGWKVIAEPPVRFRRPAGLLPLPMPQPAGSLDELAAFLNLQDRDDLMLVTTWVLAAVPGGPYPLLVIAGEQGSAKTVLSKLLRALVDPNVAPVRTLPREERDLFIAANNGHVLAFDNLSVLPPWLSDTLCRLAPFYVRNGHRCTRCPEPSAVAVVKDVFAAHKIAADQLPPASLVRGLPNDRATSWTNPSAQHKAFVSKVMVFDKNA